MSDYEVTIDQNEENFNALKYIVSNEKPNFVFDATPQDRGDLEPEIELHPNNYPNLTWMKVQYAKIKNLDSLNNLPPNFKFYYLQLNDIFNKTLPTSFTPHSNLLEIRLHNTAITGTVPSLTPFSNLRHFSVSVNSWGSWVTNQRSWNRTLAERHNATNSHPGVTNVATDFAVPSTLLLGRFQYNSIPTSGVDKILEAFDNAGGSNGLLETFGGTMGSPSSTGLTHKANLESRGWEVNVQP